MIINYLRTNICVTSVKCNCITVTFEYKSSKMNKIIFRNKNYFSLWKNRYLDLRFFNSAGSVRPDAPLFPHKDEFPSRHIGPRESDIISMLDTLGFKVSETKKCFLWAY